MSACSCRTASLQSFLRDLCGIRINARPSLSNQPSHLLRKHSIRPLRFTNVLLHTRSVYTQSEYPQSNSYASQLPAYAYKYGESHRERNSNKSRPPTLPMKSNIFQDGTSRSASAIKRSLRTADEEEARAKKRLAKKVDRVKAEKFPRNKHRVRAMVEIYGLSPKIKNRLQERLHRTKVARSGTATGETDALSSFLGEDDGLNAVDSEPQPATPAKPSRDRRRERAKQWKTIKRARSVAAYKRDKSRSISPTVWRHVKGHEAAVGQQGRPGGVTSPSKQLLGRGSSGPVAKATHVDLDQPSEQRRTPNLAFSSADRGATTRQESAQDVVEEDDEDIVVQALLEDVRLADASEGSEHNVKSKFLADNQGAENDVDSEIGDKATDQAIGHSRDKIAPRSKAKPEEASSATPTNTLPAWAVKKNTLREKFGAEGWQPRKKLSPDSLNGIRALNESNPELYTVPVLAEHLKISPEAVQRILRSKWRPKEDEIEQRRGRWVARGVRKRQELTDLKERRRMARAVRRHDLQKDFVAAFGKDDARVQARF